MANKILKKDVDTKTLNISTALNNLDNAVVTPNDLRLSLMDYMDMNKPLYKEHLTDEQLWKCIDWAVNYFNDFPPILDSTYDATDFPHKKLLLDLATVEALRLTSLIELRGEMQYSDGGVQSSIYYKSPQFSQLRQELKQNVDTEMVAIKRSLNINSCYGHLC